MNFRNYFVVVGFSVPNFCFNYSWLPVAFSLTLSTRLFPCSARMERRVSPCLTMQKQGNATVGRLDVLLSKLVAISFRWTFHVKINKILIFIEHELMSCNAT